MTYDVTKQTEALRGAFGFPPDLAVREIVTPFFCGKLLYFDGLLDVKELENAVVQPLVKRMEPFKSDFAGLLGVLYYGGNLKEIDFSDSENALLSGSAVLFTPLCIVEIAAKKFVERAVAEPPTSTVIKGPREGFVENVKTNCVLLRRRIKTADLVFEESKQGEQTSTKVVLAYVKNIVDPTVTAMIREKLSAFSLDGVTDSSYLTKLLEDHPYSLFKQVGNSEKPDVIANKLLDGKVAILCDGSPIVLYVPFTLIEDFEDAQDVYKRPMRATFLRYMRFLGAFLALLAPALFVAIQVYQFEILPVELMVTVINATGKIPFSPMLEMLIALVLFEILGEASIRMPRHVGMALGVVGAIVLGETAVQAGLLSSMTVLVVAMSGIGLYAVPDEAGTMGTLRVLFVVCAGLLGLLGVLLCGLCVLAYAGSMDSFGTPYLTPIAPIFREDLKDVLLKRNFTDLPYRSTAFRLRNKLRLKREK